VRAGAFPAVVVHCGSGAVDSAFAGLLDALDECEPRAASDATGVCDVPEQLVSNPETTSAQQP
jgi:hypothetical protein